MEQKTVLKKPDWIRVKAPVSKEYHETASLMRSLKLKTVCEEAACPNVGECWSKKHATFMILGDICTRACAFCNVKTGRPDLLDPHEPERVAQGVAELGLSHVVITSVDRDDLDDGGAHHFADVITHIRKQSPGTTIEILTVRPGARYFHSLRLLDRVKQLDPTIFTKSGIMVGLGETRAEVHQVMDDLRAANVDFMTIGQYLQPTPKHHDVIDFITPDQFDDYAKMGRGKGFLLVAASPLTRSSYHAGDDFTRLQAARLAAHPHATVSKIGISGAHT